MKKSVHNRNHSLIIIYTLFVLGNLALLLFDANLLLSVLIPYLLPAIYALSLVRNSKNKIIVFSIFSTLMLSFSFEAMATAFNFWQTNTHQVTILSLVNLENLLFFLLHQILVLSVYEVFFDRDNHAKWPKKFRLLLISYFIFGILTIILIELFPSLPLNYFVFGLVVVLIPIILELLYRPNLLHKILLVTIFWILPIFINEMVVVLKDYVAYQGEYLVMVHFLLFTIPLEEFVFWVVLSAPAIVLGYEVFADDGK